MTASSDVELIKRLAHALHGFECATSSGPPDLIPRPSALLAEAYARLSQPEPDGATVIGPEWQPCVKLSITVHVREQRPGETHSSTREGITPLRPDDLIMRGVQGEEYPIGRELFNQTYELVEPSQDDEFYFVVPPGGPPYWTSTRPIPCQP
jgi:hypothetical protein